MKTIRTNCFETNSSSTHSITIDKSYELKETVHGVSIATAEFGWEHAQYNTFEKKAAYFWTLAVAGGEKRTGLYDRMLRLAKQHGFYLTEEGSSYSYVDHGWEHYEIFVKKHPELLTDEGLYAFLTDTSCWIMTGNDNSHDTPNLRMTPNQVKACKKFLILEADERFCYAMQKDSDVLAYAGEAAHAYIEKLNKDDYTIWPHVTPRYDGTILVEMKKYNYDNELYDIISTFEMTYRIDYKIPESETNHSSVHPT